MIDGTKFPRSLFILGLLYGGMTVLAGVLGYKQIAVGPLTVEAGIFAFLFLVIVSSSVTQLYGKHAARCLVIYGAFPLVLSIFLIGFVLALPAAHDMPTENLNAFHRVMGQTPRIMTAGPIAYFISLLLNIYIFDKLRTAAPEASTQSILFRGAVAAALSQFVDTLIFVSLAFYGEFPIGPLIIGQMISKITLSVLVVPVLIMGLVKLARKVDDMP